VGRCLIKHLLQRNDQVLVLSRQPNPELPENCTHLADDPCIAGPWLSELASCDAVVHLAGENVFARRWRKRFKQRLYESRVASTDLIARELACEPKRRDGSPKVFVVASAVGYYGPHDREELDEDSPNGDDFLARICIDWEKAADPARAAGVRVCNTRIGMVLAADGGVLPKMARPFRWLVGGPAGSGQQWISWIHVEDLAGLICFALDNPNAAGPINATAPEPLTNWGFCKILGKVLHRPSWLRTPAFLLRLLLGQVSRVVTTGQRVIPRRAMKLGYPYRFPDLEMALRALLDRPQLSPKLDDRLSC
jgi:uncharacterized protein (TIGR01777 family)